MDYKKYPDVDDSASIPMVLLQHIDDTNDSVSVDADGKIAVTCAVVLPDITLEKFSGTHLGVQGTTYNMRHAKFHKAVGSCADTQKQVEELQGKALLDRKHVLVVSYKIYKRDLCIKNA